MTKDCACTRVCDKSWTQILRKIRKDLKGLDVSLARLDLAVQRNLNAIKRLEERGVK